MQSMQARLTARIESTIVDSDLEPSFASEGAVNVVRFFAMHDLDVKLTFQVQFNATYMSVNTDGPTVDEWPVRSNARRDFPYVEYAQPGKLDEFFRSLAAALMP